MTTLFALLTSLMVLGQPAPISTESGDTLADPYVDATYGFSIRPPKGWRLIRQQIPEARGITLLRMVDTNSTGASNQIVLKRTSTTRTLPMSDMLQEVSHALELEFNKVEIHAQQIQQVAGLPSAYLSASYVHRGDELFRLQAFIEIAQQQYYLLTCNGPDTLRRRNEPLFQRVLASMQFLDRTALEGKLKVALQDGANWLSGLRQEDLHNVLIDVQFFRFELDGEPVGLVKITQRPKHRDRRGGVEIYEQGWIFHKDQSVRRLQSRMFLSDDFQYERWQTSVTTLLPAKEGRPERLENSFEEGLRDQRILAGGQTYSLSSPEQQNPPIKVPPSYISRVLIRLLPRMMKDLDKPRRFAFHSFDHLRTGLMVQVVELMGKADLPGGGAVRDLVFRIDEREGWATEPSSLYVDETGRILSMQARSLTMRPVKAEEIERLFKARVKAVDQRMSRLERAYQQNENRFLRRSSNKR